MSLLIDSSVSKADFVPEIVQQKISSELALILIDIGLLICLGFEEEPCFDRVRMKRTDRIKK